MCNICKQTPCHMRCPNASEPKPVYRCAKCGYGIYEEDKYFDSPDGKICMDCMDEMSVSEILELFGERLATA